MTSTLGTTGYWVRVRVFPVLAESEAITHEDAEVAESNSR